MSRLSAGALVCWCSCLLVPLSAGALVCWCPCLLVPLSAGALVCWSAVHLSCHSVFCYPPPCLPRCCLAAHIHVAEALQVPLHVFFHDALDVSDHSLLLILNPQTLNPKP